MSGDTGPMRVTPMRVTIATDAWMPQINGVVRTLCVTVQQLIARGYEVDLIVPDQFMTLPVPGYPQIRVAVAPRLRTRRALAAFAPDVVHIVTEGPIGWAARRWCMDHQVPFTTAFHTRFPEYAAVRTGLSPEWFWPIMRRFHGPSQAVFGSTQSLISELAGRGLDQGRLWSRGIDAKLFRPDGPVDIALSRLPKPLMLSVGRVAAEKNLDAFLGLDLPGTKIVVGDGPALGELKRKYPDVVFLGALEGEALARVYRTADVFVFPSHTDTFGLVMIEALACGVPVAAFPVAGPLDILGKDGRGAEPERARASGGVALGALHDDLAYAIQYALRSDRGACVAFGRTYEWGRCTDQFVAGLNDAMSHVPGATRTQPRMTTLQA